MRKNKSISISTLFFVFILMAGICIMLYPIVSDFWNSLHQSRAIASYDELVGNVSQIDKEAVLKDAQIYNAHLYDLESPIGDFGQINHEYKRSLDVAGNGIMGYVTIDKINVQLPIYHGTDEGVLNVGVGHLEGSSLPVGGESTHCVLSAHRGLPSAKLFTDLDQMERGDIFTITVMDEVYMYEVDQILIVEPTQTKGLQIVDGMDYVTLQTCTPYGINSHRLLVRGHRTSPETASLVVHNEAVIVPSYVAAFAVMIPALMIILFILVLHYRKKEIDITPEEISRLSAQIER